jgi:hypothetical protein
MNTACLPPITVIPLHTPWWRRLLRAAADAWVHPVRRVRPEANQPETWLDPDLRALRHLSPGTLRDIGAPDWVYEARDGARDRALNLLRL